MAFSIALACYGTSKVISGTLYLDGAYMNLGAVYHMFMLYILGAGMAMLEGLYSYVCQAKCSGETTDRDFMFIGGVTNFLLALILPVLGVPSLYQVYIYDTIFSFVKF